MTARPVLALLAAALLVGAPISALAGRDDGALLEALGLSADALPSPATESATRSLLRARSLSTDGRACVTCHSPDRAWSGAVRRRGSTPAREVPSLHGAGEAVFLFWDGRAASLEAQVMEVLENPLEMNGSRLLVAREAAKVAPACGVPATLQSALDRLPKRQLAGKAAASAYERLSQTDKDLIDRAFACVAHQLAEEVRNIPQPGSAWLDAARRRGPPEVPEAAYRGAQLFVGKARCATCHYGPYFTDGQFHNIGLSDTGANEAEPGRYAAVTAMAEAPYNRLAARYFPSRIDLPAFRPSEEMWGAFKTPTLVGVAKTAPYMHNGRLRSLEEVVRYYDTLDSAVFPEHHYGTLMTPLGLTPQERADLVAFLRTL